MSARSAITPADLAVDGVEPLTTEELPLCSIVILNWNGKHHLAGCFESLQALDYPEERFEVVLIDNGSVDGSAAEVRERHGWVRLIENETNVGFSAGCNQGAREARATREDGLLVFLNDDMRVDPGFLRALVAPIVRGRCVATTARMYSWDGKVMNSAGGGMNFHGLGIQRGYLDAPGPEFDVPRQTLFACGGAMAMDAGVFDDVGGFDSEFFAYYEDVDLGWRTWVLGHEIHYVPDAVCYHHHSSTSGRVPVERLRLLQVRNPLLACFKNYDDERLRQILPAMLALATRRAFVCSGIPDLSAYRIEQLAGLREPGLWARLRQKVGGGGGGGTEAINRVAVADLIAINDLLGRWEHWMRRRAEVQDRRKRPDEDIFRLFLRPMWCIEDDEGYRELQAGAASFLGIDALFEGLTTMEKDPPR